MVVVFVWWRFGRTAVTGWPLGGKRVKSRDATIDAMQHDLDKLRESVRRLELTETKAVALIIANSKGKIVEWDNTATRFFHFPFLSLPESSQLTLIPISSIDFLKLYSS